MKIKHVISILILGLFLLLLSNNKAEAASDSLSNGGTYTIKSAIDENYVINISGASNSSYANVEIMEWANKENQRFVLNSFGNGTYTIKALHSNKNIDIHVSSMLKPNNVIQYQAQDYIYQKWIIKSAGNGYYNIVSKYNGLYLTVDGGQAKNGANVFLMSYTGDASQKFKFELFEDVKLKTGTYTVKSAKNDNFVLNIAGATNSSYGNLEIREEENKENQRFIFSNNEDGTFFITALHSNKNIDIHVSSALKPNNVIQYEKQNYIYQKWLVRSAGDGYCYIVSKYNGLYMTIDNGQVSNGANISLQNYNGEASQKFKFEQYENAKIKSGEYTIKSAKNKNYVLNISGATKSSYGNLELGKNKNKKYQGFKVTTDSNDYMISALHSNKNLDIHVSSTLKPNNVIQYDKQNYIYQKWIIRAAGDDYYYIVSKYNDLYMTIDGGEAREAANISLKPYIGDDTQKFKFETFTESNVLEENEEVKIKNGTYRISSAQNSRYVLNVANATKNSYGNIEVTENENNLNQKFKFNNIADNTYTIGSGHSDKYLDIHMSSSTSPNNVIQYHRQDYIYQKWTIKYAGDNSYYIVSKYNGLYMTIDGGEIKNGANISLKAYTGDISQKFKLDQVEDAPSPIENNNAILEKGEYKIVSACGNSFGIDVAGSSSNNYANIQIMCSKDENNQKFIIKSSGENTYTITAGHSNKLLDIDLASGNNVIQYQYQGYIYQDWKLKDAGDGYYYIVSAYNGQCIDIAGGTAADCANVITRPYSGYMSQKFRFVKTTITDAGRSAKFKREHPEIRIGIDVSKYQGKIDWNAVKRDGIDYVMIRAGFRGYGENGSLNEDPKLDEYVRGARAAGLDVGIYFFSQATCYQEGVTEANYTLGLIRKYDITYPVAFDTEDSSSPTHTGRADGISVQARTDAAKGFCSTIKAAGYDTLIYASPSWLKDELYLNQLAEYDIWLANYTGATQEDPLKRPSSYKGKYVMWQYTDSGTVNGINGKVDCDLFYYLK